MYYKNRRCYEKRSNGFLVDGYKFVVDNKCSSLGCYYGEDDWTVEVIAEDLETLQKLAIEEIVKSRVWEDGKRLYKITYLEYNGSKYVVTEDACSREETQKVFGEIIKSQYYKGLMKLRKENDKEEESRKQKQLDKEKELQEKKLYKDLKKKYEKD